MKQVGINGRWPLLLPEHRAARPEWPFWEAGRLAAMHHHLGNHHGVVYDIGAEEGDLPALWATWGCEVVMFEPNPRVWPNIKTIWEANNLTPLGCYVGFAGSESRGWADWPATGEWPACAHGEVIGDHGFLNLWERPDVPSITIDDAATQYKPPTALTIDVEGAELQVLLGAQKVLLEHRPKVWISVHVDFMRDGYGDDPVEIIDLMESLDYDRTFIAEDHEEHWQFLPR